MLNQNFPSDSSQNKKIQRENPKSAVEVYVPLRCNNVFNSRFFYTLDAFVARNLQHFYSEIGPQLRAAFALLRPQLADVWRIENTQSILKEKTRDEHYNNEEHLLREIRKNWKTFTPQKCKDMMSEIPNCLKQVIVEN